MEINYGEFAFYKTKLGVIKIGYLCDKITYLKFYNEKKTEVFNQGKRSILTWKVYLEVLEYLEGKRKIFDFPLLLLGTEFQMSVWSELLNIPYGETRTYREIAITLGNSNASRAVGMACNRNPILVIVPCHRVIGSNGTLVGYAGGLEWKNVFLQLERKNKQLNLFDSI